MIKVLIVDDEYIMRQGLKYMINWEQEGYTIVGEATNGSEALRLTEELQPHIVISDIVMPMLDGVDFSELLHKMYPQIQIIILSGYDKFEYVKQTLMNGVVDYILKPTLNQDELLKILQKASERIPGYKLNHVSKTVSHEHLLERYLLGLDKELDYGKFQDCFFASYYRIYAVNVKKEGQNGQDISDILYKKIERKLREFTEMQYKLLMLREELVCIIFCYDGPQNRRLLSFIEELNGQLAALCGDILGVVSAPFSSLEELYAVYANQIVKNVEKSFYYENVSLLMTEMHQDSTQGAANVRFDFFKYNQLLGAKQFGDAAILLKKYNEQAVSVQMDAYRLKNQMKNMLYHFMDFLQISDEEKENKRYLYFKEISKARYQSGYMALIDTIMKDLLDLSGQSLPIVDERIEKILEYIAHNYQKDLKLEDLAEKFSFNYHYLSAYFNQQMKEGFSDYLNRLRIEKACELLKDDAYTISEVSSEVGYSEHSYFCRVFKKITGRTPSVWRRTRYDEEI